MRATSSALFFLVLNIIGLGCGPTIVGTASDMLKPLFGDDSLRYAMIIVIPCACIWASTHFLLAARAYKKYTAEKVKDSASATIF